MQELRLLELEENIRRKDLSEYEKNKAMVVYVEAVKRELRSDFSSESEENQNPIGRPAKKDSGAIVAYQTGIPESTASVARTHVETADAFPFMQSWPQWAAEQNGRARIQA